MDREVFRVMGEVKPSYDTNRQVLGKILPLKTPFNVIIDTSERCNFQCSYCFRNDIDCQEHWGYAKRNDVMEWEIFEKAVAQIKEFPEDVKQISLSNHGEPLCNRKIPQMVQYIKKSGIKSRISIHTNASLLNESYIEELAESDIDKVVVSLQGLSSPKYFKVCKATVDFEKLYDNLRSFYQKKKHTQIHIKIMDSALEDGEDTKFYNLFVPISDRAFIEQEVPIWKGRESNSETDKILNKYGEAFPRQLCCPLIFHTLVVATNGDAYPCTQLLREDKLGNINETSLREMWDGAQRTELLMRQCELNNPRICDDCYIRQNSIYSEGDMIDNYRDEILSRMKTGRANNV